MTGASFGYGRSCDRGAFSQLVSVGSVCFAMELTKEHHLTFPPSANWYNFNASDLSLENKYFAYGAKNTVCVFEVVGLKFVLVKRFYGHVNTSRVSSIQFGKHASVKSTLISGCTCGELRAWDLQASSCVVQDSPLYTRSPHDNRPITSLALSSFLPDLTISADAKGYLSVITTTSQYKCEPLKSAGPITSVVCSPYVKNLVVVGYRNGALAVFDWCERTVVSRLHGHEQEIQGISFLPPNARDKINSARQKYLNDCHEAMENRRKKKMDIDRMATNSDSYVVPLVTEEGIAIYTPEQLRSLRYSSHRGEYDISDNLRPLHQKTVVDADARLRTKYANIPALLVTSSRDRKIKVWDATSWRLLDTMVLPLPGGLKKKNKGKRYNGGRSITNSQSERLWLTVKFAPIELNDKIENVGILSSSYMGEILLWPWRWQGEQKFGESSISSDNTVRPMCLAEKNQSCSTGHNRPVFNILVHRSANMGSFRGDTWKSSVSFITSSMDRKIILWEKKAPVMEIPCLGGYVYDLSYSPVTPNLCAVAVGDRTIRVWDTSEEDDPLRSTTHWNGLQSEVTSICWHPSREGVVAYGTNDGKTGLFDVLKDKNVPFPNMSNSPVRHVEFRNDNTMYACNEAGDLLEFVLEGAVFKMVQLNEKTVDNNVKLFNARSKLASNLVADENLGKSECLTSFSWKCNVNALFPSQDSVQLDVVAVGYRDGTVILVSMPSTEAFSSSVISGDATVVHYQNHQINDIRWFGHPTKFEDKNIFLFATASNDRTARVFSCSCDEIDNVQPNPPFCVRDIATFVGHQKPTIQVAWHPNEQDVLLASASRDGTANVWDVMKKVAIANFRGCHGVPLRCLAFSPINQCMVCTGSDDQSIVVWDIYSQSSSSPPEKNSTYYKDFSRRMKNNKVKSIDKLNSNGDKNNTASEPKDLKIEANTLQQHDATANVPSQRKSSKKKKGKTIIPLLQPGGDDLMHLVQALNTSSKVDADQEAWDALEKHECLLERQVQSHRERGAFAAGRSLEIWRGDINTVIQRMIQEKRLTADYVALSVSGGIALWQTAAEAYAQQLEEKGEIHNAVLYLLSISKIYDAIDVYLRARLYRDALSLAVARLSPLDPVIHFVCKEFGKSLEKQGKLISAREVYLVAREEKRAMACQKKMEVRQEILNTGSLPAETEELDSQVPSSDSMPSEAVCLKGEGVADSEKKNKNNYFSNFKRIMKFGTGGP